MSSRSGSSYYPTQWSEWVWDREWNRYKRYRLVRQGEYEYDYDNQEVTGTSDETNQVPIDAYRSAGYSSNYVQANDEYKQYDAVTSSSTDIDQVSSKFNKLRVDDSEHDLNDQQPFKPHSSLTPNSSFVRITLYGRHKDELEVPAVIDTGTEENWMSHDCVKSLGMKITKGHSITTRIRTISGNVEVVGSVSCSMSYQKLGRKVKLAFNVFRQGLRKVILGGESQLENGRQMYQELLLATSPAQQHIYSLIKVHCIWWKNEGGLVCEPEVKDLIATFRDRFSLQSSTFRIPDYDAQGKVTANIRDTLKSCTRGELLILYYSGHGSLADSGQLEMVQDDGPGLFSWVPIQDMLEGTKADVLLLLDCCHAGGATKGRMPAVKILLAACDENRRTHAPPDPYHRLEARTFTAALMTALNSMDRMTFSAARIREMISSKMEEWRNELPENHIGRTRRNEPVWDVFSREGGAVDIRLMPRLLPTT